MIAFIYNMWNLVVQRKVTPPKLKFDNTEQTHNWNFDINIFTTTWISHSGEDCVQLLNIKMINKTWLFPPTKTTYMRSTLLLCLFLLKIQPTLKQNFLQLKFTKDTSSSAELSSKSALDTSFGFPKCKLDGPGCSSTPALISSVSTTLSLKPWLVSIFKPKT